MTLVKIRANHSPQDYSTFMQGLLNGMPKDYPVIENGTGKNAVPVNILENETAYLLELAAPGFSKEAFRINVEKQVLTISVEKNTEEKQATEKYIRKEFVNRSFKRSFILDEKINDAGIEATYVNGILTLNLPKKLEVKPEKKEIIIN